MGVAAVLGWPISATAKYFSTSSHPVHRTKGPESTHPFINVQGRRILFNDGHRKASHIFNIFADQLDRGVVWIDKGLKNACHYYDSENGCGIWLWPSAADKCNDFFTRALDLWKDKKHARAMFFLGAAIHLVQDLCVPHHACCKIFSGHNDFESWADRNKNNYMVDSQGLYGISDNPEDWIAENARLAREYYTLVESSTPEKYHRATKILLPRAQATTAGFLLLFYQQLEK